MEPEGSLYLSKEHATGPCPEPGETNQQLTAFFPERAF